MVHTTKCFSQITENTSHYFSLAHSILSYGIIFWGISNYSKIIFKIQKRMIRIIMNVDSRTSCRNLFKQLNILPLKSQYIFSLMMFVGRNRELFIINANVHNFPTRSHNDLHLPIANLSVFQKGCIFLVLKFLIIFQPTLNKHFMTFISLKKL